MWPGPAFTYFTKKMTSTSSSEIRLTIESFPGTTDAARRTSIFARWKEVQAAITTGVRSLSLPGLNGTLDGDAIADYKDLLTACLEVLDASLGNDPGLAAAEPMGITVDFSRRPMMW